MESWLLDPPLSACTPPPIAMASMSPIAMIDTTIVMRRMRVPFRPAPNRRLWPLRPSALLCNGRSSIRQKPVSMIRRRAAPSAMTNDLLLGRRWAWDVWGANLWPNSAINMHEQ